MKMRRLPVTRTFMRAFGFALSLSLPLTLVAQAASVQGGYVERALELGLIHECVTGLDAFPSEVTDELEIDWLQSGVAVGDVDGDGRLDVVACGSVNPNTLLLGGPAGFTDHTAASGIDGREYDRVPALGDYDRDGDLDLFIGSCEGGGTGPTDGRSRLYRNEGGAVFEDVTALAGTRGSGRSVYAQWNDLDLDGRLDLYVAEFYLTPNHWYRNNGDGSFSDLTDERGLSEAGSAHVAAALDCDRDGDPDVFVGNDYKVASSLNYPDEINPGDEFFVNEDGVFDEISQWIGLNHKKGIMGFAWGDVNYDGLLDLYKTDVGANKLCINYGAPALMVPWQNEQSVYGIADAEAPFPDSSETGPGIAWSAFFFNSDFDRWLDLFVVNGHVAAVNPHAAHMPPDQPNTLYHGLGPGAGFTFANVTQETGMWYREDERGAAMADMDADGDLDFLVLADAGRLRYFENQLDRKGQGSILVEADTRTSVPGGVGTYVEWTDPEGYPHVRVIGVDAPTASQNQNMAFFGLGYEASADLLVTFPSGMQRLYGDVPANSHLIVEEPELIRLERATAPVNVATFGDKDLTVTVFAHSSDGTPLDGTAAVTLDIVGLTPLTPVTHVQDNEFERTFATNNTAREYIVDVAFDGWKPLIEPRFHIFGTPDATKTLVTAVPQSVRAGSTDTFVIWVTPRDSNGVGMGSGRAVSIDLPGLTSTSGVIDHGDGRYSAAFAAPATPMNLGANLVIEGALIATASPIVNAAGPPNAATTVVDVQVALPPQAASPHQVKIQISPRDAGGRSLGPNASVSVRVLWAAQTQGAHDPDNDAPPRVVGPAIHGGSHASGSLGEEPQPSVWIHPDYGHIGQDDGDFLFVMEKVPEMSFLPEGEIEVEVDGAVLGPWPYSYKPQLGVIE